MTEQANVIIIGGGVIGLSIAYHLSGLGVDDIIILERNEFLGAGSTAAAAGGIRAQFTTPINIKMAQESIKAYKSLPRKTECPFVFVQSGYLFFTTQDKTLEQFEINAELQRSLGVEVEVLSGDNIRERWPWILADDVIGGTFSPSDGYASPNDAVAAYTKKSREQGVTIRTETTVQKFDMVDGRIRTVKTDKGEFTCETVINATGPYLHEIGKMAGADIPAHPYRRMLFFTDATPTLPNVIPLTVDFDTGFYCRKETDGLLLGRARHDEPRGFNLTVDWEYAGEVVETALRRIPVLETASLATAWAGLYSITPDHHPIIGRAPECQNMIIAGGFSGHGFMQAPITGILVAELVQYGETRTLDIHPLRPERFEEGDILDEMNVI